MKGLGVGYVLMATQMPPVWTKTQLEGLDRQNLRCRAMDLAAFLKVDLPSLTAECVIDTPMRIQLDIPCFPAM